MRARYANLVLGVWLLASAFLWPHGPAQFRNAWSVGALCIVVASLAMALPPVRYANTTLGALALCLDPLSMSVADVPLGDQAYCTFSRDAGAAELLENLNGRQEVFPVVEDGKLVGVIALDDLSVLASEPQMFHGLVNAADLMRPPLALGPQDDLHRALETMFSHGLRELPVVDGEGRVLGLLGETAIAHAYVRNQNKSGTPSVAAHFAPAGAPLSK